MSGDREPTDLEQAAAELKAFFWAGATPYCRWVLRRIATIAKWLGL